MRNETRNTISNLVFLLKFYKPIKKGNDREKYGVTENLFEDFETDSNFVDFFFLLLYAIEIYGRV